MHLFTLHFAKLGLALCFGEAVTLKEQMSGGNPSFTNHTGHETLIKWREAMPQRNCKPVHRLPRISSAEVAVFINFEDLVRHVQGSKNLKSEAPSSADSNASKIDKFEDPYKEIWQKHWALRGLKSALDRLQRWSKTGIAHSIGVRWG